METRFSMLLCPSNAFDSFVQISILIAFHFRNIRFQHDRAAAIRDRFESFVHNCKKVMHPDVYLSLDETIYPTRVGAAFYQYNKDKPAKYGLLFRSINSAEVVHLSCTPTPP